MYQAPKDYTVDVTDLVYSIKPEPTSRAQNTRLADEVAQEFLRTQTWIPVWEDVGKPGKVIYESDGATMTKMVGMIGVHGNGDIVALYEKREEQGNIDFVRLRFLSYHVPLVRGSAETLARLQSGD